MASYNGFDADLEIAVSSRPNPYAPRLEVRGTLTRQAIESIASSAKVESEFVLFARAIAKHELPDLDHEKKQIREVLIPLFRRAYEMVVAEMAEELASRYVGLEPRKRHG